jgi:hypothetical protein
MGQILQFFEACLTARCGGMAEASTKPPSTVVIDAVLPPGMVLSCKTAGAAKAGSAALMQSLPRIPVVKSQFQMGHLMPVHYIVRKTPDG